MIIASYLLGAFAFIGGIGLTVSSGWLITMAAQHPPILTLSVAIVGVRFFGISRSAARYAERVISHNSVFNRLTSLRVLLYKRIEESSIKFIREFSSSSAVKTLVDDVERAQEYQLRVVLPRVAAYIALFFGSLVGVWVNSKALYVVVPALVLTLIIIPRFIIFFCERFALRIEELENEYTNAIEVSTYGVTEAQIYGYLGEFQKGSVELINSISRTEQKLHKKSLFLNYLTSLTIGASLISFVYMAYRLREIQNIPAVQVAMLIFLPLVLFEAVTSWYPNLFSAGKLISSAKSVSKLASSTDNSKKGTIQLTEINELEATSLQVSWANEFMQPVSFKVKRGELCVIRGRSGSGKSTLAMGLLGLLPHRGLLVSNGIELADIADLSGLMAGTVQRSHIFNTTVRENLRIANPDVTDEQMLFILTLVELAQLIDELPEGLDTLIGDYGRTLSGGEAKRLSVARALLSNADVIILDEPTEHLDSDLAHRIETAVKNFLANRILIVITHSGWVQSDTTVIMKGLSPADS